MDLKQAILHAQSGDLILMGGGDYGVMIIQGLHQDYVTLAAYSHDTPKFERIEIGGRNCGWLQHGRYLF
jgi:hypothetical protein